MNPDDPLETWIASRRSAAPPSEFIDRVMNAVMQSPAPRLNPDDPLETWIASRRSAAPPPEFIDRVMNAVMQSPAPRPAARSKNRSRLEAAACLLLFACSLAVAVIRFASLVGIVAPSPTEEPAITREFFEEQPHVRDDVT